MIGHKIVALAVVGISLSINRKVQKTNLSLRLGRIFESIMIDTNFYVVCEDTHVSSIKYFYVWRALQYSWYCKIISSAKCKTGGNHGQPLSLAWRSVYWNLLSSGMCCYIALWKTRHQLQHNNGFDSGPVENIISPVTTIIYSVKKQFVLHHLFFA
jgi:hypothetical protein